VALARAPDAPPRIRVGVVGASVTAGASDWAAHAHIPALRALPQFELVAVCTSRPETAQPSADRFGTRLAFHDVAAMAAHPEVDLVTVALRVPSHRRTVLASLAQGTPTYCEWPLAVDAAEASELARAAGDVPSYLGLQLRADPAARAAAAGLRAGVIGEVLGVSVSLTSPLQARCKPEREWMAANSAGAHPLSIHGGHLLDLVTLLFGDIAEVQARIRTRVETWYATDGRAVTVDAPDSSRILAGFATGAELDLSVSAVPGGVAQWSLLAHGTRGRLELGCTGAASIGPNRLAVVRHDGGAPAAPPPAGDLDVPPAAVNVARNYELVAAHWPDDAIAQPTGVGVAGFVDGVRVHRVLAAAQRSSDEGTVVRVEPSKPKPTSPGVAI
jgi:predicted dehydrogenase